MRIGIAALTFALKEILDVEGFDIHDPSFGKVQTDPLKEKPVVLLSRGCDVGSVVLEPDIAPLFEGVGMLRVKTVVKVCFEFVQFFLYFFLGLTVKISKAGFPVCPVAVHHAQLPAGGSAANCSFAVKSFSHITPFPVYPSVSQLQYTMLILTL